MSQNQDEFSVAAQCRVLGVARSGFYAARRRTPSARARKNLELLQTIRTVHAESRGTYGVPRIHAELTARGIHVGRKRVARLMARAGLRGACRRRVVFTTVRDPENRPAPDLVDRKFTAERPNQLWVADITYVPTGEGFLYLAIVLDVFSRRVVAWFIGTTLRTEVVLAALDMAVARRRPTGVIHHSDRGCQYTSTVFGKRCEEYGVRPSTGSVGDAYDNAMAESFFGTLESELFDRRLFRTHAEARVAIFDYIERWYNPRRRHSALGYLSPIEFERRAASRITGEDGHAA